VTDAYVALGLIQPENFLGGRIHLDAGKAEAALLTVGERLGLDAAQTAASIVDVTTSNMYAQFMPIMAKKGIDPRDFTILAYGGAGPTHAFLLAKEVGIRGVVVPKSPGTLCALGSLVTDLKSDFIKTLYADTADFTVDALDQQFRALEEEAQDWLAAQHVETTETYTIRSADMRYKGQSFDITVPLTEAFQLGSDMDAIRAPFHESYERIYGFSDEKASVELINGRVTIVGVTPKPRYATISENGSGSQPAQSTGERRVLEERQWVTAQVFSWDALTTGDSFSGPAVVEAVDTTVFVPSGFAATIDDWGNIVARED
jgi:N-methylhydantoinase A